MHSPLNVKFTIDAVTGIQDGDHSKWAAADSSLRPHGHRYRCLITLVALILRIKMYVSDKLKKDTEVGRTSF
jgi:hypothetical protein